MYDCVRVVEAFAGSSACAAVHGGGQDPHWTACALPPSGGGDSSTSVFESSTEHTAVGKDLDGKILLWNEGARRLYGYEAEEVIGKVNSSALHEPEDVQSGKHREITQTALEGGKWEGTLNRVRGNGHRFIARVVNTRRRDSAGKPIGFLLISKDISNEARPPEDLKATQFYTHSRIESNIDALMTNTAVGAITDVNRQVAWRDGGQMRFNTEGLNDTRPLPVAGA